MAGSRHKGTCRTIYRLVNEGDVEGVLSRFHEDGVSREPFPSRVQVFPVTPGKTEVKGRQRPLREFLEAIQAVGIQVHLDSLKLWGEGDVVVAEYSLILGDLTNIMVDIWEFEGEKVRELRHYPDTLAFHILGDLRRDEGWTLD